MRARLTLLLTLLLLLALPTRAHAQEESDSTATADSVARADSIRKANAPPVQPPPPRGRQSWTSDRRAFMLGDIVTVLVDEFTLLSAANGNTALDTRRRNADFSLQTGTPPGTNFGLDTRNDAESRQRGEATRTQRLQSELSVRVVAIDPQTGLLNIKGTRLVALDKSKQEVMLSGWIRPQDVTLANTVDSWRVADAQVAYTGKGPLGKPKGGIVGRVLGGIWP